MKKIVSNAMLSQHRLFPSFLESAPAGRESISSQDLPDGSPLRSSIFKKFDSILKGEFIRTSKQIPSVLKEVSPT